MKNSGIYKIQSVIKPERFYIGSAVNFKDRWNNHISQLRKNIHHSKKLQRHYNKYGELDLVFIITEPCFPQFLIIREQYYIDTLKPYFNICPKANSQLGIKRSKEVCRKMSISMQGKNKSKGRIMNEETKQKISIANKNKHFGPLSEEHRKKLSMVKIGMKLSKEHCNRISESKKGYIMSEETKRKIGKANNGNKNWFGKRHSEKAKQNMRDGWVLRKLKKAS